ncbi:hypothetical protein [Pseudoxanthomonas sp. 10H]|uniref:hypothetical protein n=1 Tax=Pseudoxanthomonas sp. 10H TaxID=3242729 RepID=UPI003559073F
MHLIVKTAAAAALGVLAWKAWQRRRATVSTDGLRDAGEITPAHGDPRVPAVEEDVSYEPRVAAHSSPGFGG